MSEVGKGINMRRLSFTSLFLLMVTVLSIGLAGSVSARSLRAPVDPEALLESPFLGTWIADTSVGQVTMQFEPDGTVVLDMPVAVPAFEAVAYATPAVGTWDLYGNNGAAAFEAVQSITHANGVLLGNATINGYLLASDDASVLFGPDIVATVVVRDSHNTVIWASNLGEKRPVMTASAVEIRSAGLPAAAVGEYEALLGNGGRDCATCAPAQIGGPIGTTDELSVAAPVREGRGCNTCR